MFQKDNRLTDTTLLNYPYVIPYVEGTVCVTFSNNNNNNAIFS